LLGTAFHEGTLIYAPDARSQLKNEAHVMSELCENRGFNPGEVIFFDAGWLFVIQEIVGNY
jgi:hypothetical protein